MGRGKRKLTIQGWYDFLNNKSVDQMYWFLRHLNYTRDDVKAIVQEYAEVSLDALKGLSFRELIAGYQTVLVDYIVSSWIDTDVSTVEENN